MRNKIIRRPSFILLFLISLIVVFVVLGCIGSLVYLYFEAKYDNKVLLQKTFYESNLNNVIYSNLNGQEISWENNALIKEALIDHYKNTDQRVCVYHNGYFIADSSQTAILNYYKDNDRKYTFQLADSKYLEYFKTPEVTRYEFQGDSVYGFITNPYIVFRCNEFYVDYRNARFIPAVVTIYQNIGDDIVPTSTEVRITPDDITGFSLIKITPVTVSDHQSDYATGIIAGYTGSDSSEYYTDIYYGNTEYLGQYQTRRTIMSTRSFYESYDAYINLGQVVLVVSSIIIALITATIRYYIDRRNYDIYEYRRKMCDAMAHDLKTPLAAISAYAENLQNHIGTNKQEYYASKINEKVGQMNKMVNDILVFSKADDSRGKIDKRECKVSELLRDIINDNEQKISERGLIVDIDDPENIVLTTDRDLFYQALGNIINNAVLYAKEKSRVRISCSSSSIKIRNQLQNSIDNVSTLKDPFTKGTSSRQNGGTGLGLAIADNDLAMISYKLEIKVEGEDFIASILLR